MNKSVLLAILSSFASASQPLFYWDRQQECDCLCSGGWVINAPEKEADQPIVSWEIEKQSFNLKDNIVRGEEVAVWGRGVVIQAPYAHFCYAPTEAQEWDFPKGASVWTQRLLFEAQSVQYHQAENQLSAQEMRFLLPAQGFWGQCAHLSADSGVWVAHDLRLTACPPESSSWDLRSQNLRYDQQEDTLTIERPTLHWGEYSLLSLPDMSFDGVRAEHRLENIPRISVTTQSGLGLSFPMLWTRAHESIEVIPEINLKRGLGFGVNIEKSGVLARSFLQLFPSVESESRYWMAELVSAYANEDFAYAYQGALISSNDFVYAYPHALTFEDNLYYPNRVWARHTLGLLGQLQITAEKLYLSDEAQDADFEVIEKTFHVEWDYHRDFLYSEWGGDLFYHTNDDRQYARLYGQQELYFGREQQLRFSLVHYPEESFSFGSGAVIQSTPWREIGIGRLGALVIGRLSVSSGSSPLIDTTAQPLSFQSLIDWQWHQGQDWVSHGLQITPRWQIDLSKGTQAELVVSYAIDKPQQPWVAASQPYLTPFRDDDRFSPIGLRVQSQQWDASALFDGSRWQWITSEWRRTFGFAYGQAHLGAYYHRYFPVDRLSEQTERVAQMVLGYHAHPEQPWMIDFESRVNLIPIELSQALLKIRYQHCCWNAGIKVSAQKEYDRDSASMKWQYRLGFGIELVGTGLGSEETRRKAFELMPEPIGVDHADPWYVQQV